MYASMPPLKCSDVQNERMRRTKSTSLWILVSILAGIYFFVLCRVPSKWTFAVGIMNIAALITTIFHSVLRFDRIYALHYLPMHSMCPACGHSLTGLAPESDGCTVCPECGAAWKIPTV
jgi:hypothetical protein